MTFRFVHTADLHLDSPLRSLALRSPALADVVSNATRQALERIVDLCLEERVDALMIAGDLYDGAQQSMKTAVFFGSRMRRLAEAGIKAFIIRGNHDAQSTITRHLSLPENVHVLRRRDDSVRIDNRDVTIHGISFSEPRAEQSLLPHYAPPHPGGIDIGLMHTSLAGSEGHDVYAPCSVADLAGHGYAYWALGHIHKRRVHVENDCTIVMPGMPQGRDVNEAGPKTVTLVTAGDDGRIELEERITSIAQFERVEVDLTGVDDWRETLDIVETSLQIARNECASDQLIARLTIQGTTPIAMRLRRDADLLLNEARQVADSLGKTWIEDLSIDLGSKVLLDQRNAAGPVDELRSLVASDLLDSSQLRDEARSTIVELQRKLPPELRHLLGDDEAALDAMVTRLIGEGSEEVFSRFQSGKGDAS